MPSRHLILCHLLLLSPSVFPSIRVFSNESAVCIRWPKYWSFSFNISPSNEYSGLISFRMDWLDLLVVQGTLKNLLQHHQGIRSSNTLTLIHFSYTEISSPFGYFSVYISTHMFTSFLFIYWLWDMWDLSSPPWARDQTHILGIRSTEF